MKVHEPTITWGLLLQKTSISVHLVTKPLRLILSWLGIKKHDGILKLT